MAETSLVKVASTSSVTVINPRLLRSCTEAGLTGELLTQAMGMVKDHRTNLISIVRWTRKYGLELDRIERYLDFRDTYHFGWSVPLLHWYLDSAGFRFTEAGTEDIVSTGFGADGPEVIIEFFHDIAERIGGRYPHQRIRHVIKEYFSGNVLEAYAFGTDKPDQLLTLIDAGYGAYRLSARDTLDIEHIVKGDIHGWSY